MGEFDVLEKKEKKEWYRDDLKVLMSQIAEHESVLRLKRRWLMDLPLSSIEKQRIKELLPLSDRTMPERLLREDDVGYEDIRRCVESGFGAHARGIEDQSIREDLQELNPCYDVKDIFRLLDDLTNRGLCLMSEILSGGTIKFEKTNQNMKRIIRELLPKVFEDKSSVSQTKLNRLFQLLKEPGHFRRDKVAVQLTASEAYRAAAVEVLEELVDFPLRTLKAMHRKLIGVRDYVPKMHSSKSGRSRDHLIKVVKQMCMKLLSSLGETDVPGEPLSGALAVADLALTLTNHRPSLRIFKIFPPEVIQLQNDIAKAIHLLDYEKRGVSYIELKKAQLLLDPDLKLTERNLRIGVRNLLIEYLFECGDMDNVPDYILKILEIINRTSHSPSRRKQSSRVCSSPHELMKMEIENAVECILAVSAQAKEILLEQLPKHEFDEDFAEAYMGDSRCIDTLSVSDDEDEDICNMFHNDEFSSLSPFDLEESIGEIDPPDLITHVSTSDEDGSSSALSRDERSVELIKSIEITRMGSDAAYSFDHSLHNSESKVLNVQCVERECSSSGCAKQLEFEYSDSLRTPMTQNSRSLYIQSPAMNSGDSYLKSKEAVSCSVVNLKLEDVDSKETELIRFGNQYLEIQEACDQTSMVAYRFVGRVLEMLARTGGLELYHGDRSYLCSYSSISEGEVSTSDFRRLWEDVIENERLDPS